MLKLSTKGRYGLRAMIDLAGLYNKGPVLMADIAERQGFSRKYLHALLTSLKGAGLVESVRGARGGYLLAKPPEDIRINEVFEALEGPVSIVDCLSDGGECDRLPECLSRGMWQEINNSIASVLKSKTLADLTHGG
jgi:Rrf2 family cysteine metabolism transcriptional repressor